MKLAHLFDRTEIRAEPKDYPLEQNCSTCRHCVAFFSWWCTNKHAIESRGTAIPGGSCRWWVGALPDSRDSGRPPR